MAPIEPYIKKDPNELLRSRDWNDLQIRAREEIHTHTHQGGEDGTPIPREGIQPHAIDGTRIDPTSKVTVAQLKVSDRDLLMDIDSLIARADAFDAKVNDAEARLGTLEMLMKPVREQLVHRRVIFGYAGDEPPHPFTSVFSVARPTLYLPFSSVNDRTYPLPDVQPHARRRFRLYAVYSDTIQEPGHKIVVRFEALDNPALGAEFFLERAWGLAPAGGSRDGYSSWVDGVPFTTNSTLKVRTTEEKANGTLFYIELHAWDFF